MIIHLRAYDSDTGLPDALRKIVHVFESAPPGEGGRLWRRAHA